MPSSHSSADISPIPVPAARAARGIKRWLLQTLALLSLGTALLGLVLPGLPSTEFVLLAVWAAARSSPRLHAWILRHRLLGPLWTQWQQGRLPRRAKWTATATMSLSALLLATQVSHVPSVIVMLGCMAAVLAWLWRRPEP